MSKGQVLVLVLAAFVLGLWIGDVARSPVNAQVSSSATQKPMFQEVVVPDKAGEWGSVYVIYNGPGQICPYSQKYVALKPKGEKAGASAPSAYDTPKASKKKAVEPQQ